MNKLLTKIVGAALGLSMSVGVGVAVAVNNNRVIQTNAITSGSSVAYSYTFTAKQFSDDSTAKTLASTSPSLSVTWTPTTTWSEGSGFWGYDSTKGQQWGSGSNTLNTMTITSSVSFTNVTDIVVNASIASSGGCKLTTKVGSTSIGSERTLTTTATEYTQTNASGLTGTVSITLSNGSKKKAQYIKSIVIYTKASQTYTVSFNNNGGSGSMSNVTNVSGSYTLPACTFTAPSGKTFSGWKANNAGDLIAVGGSYTVSANVTFYAQWVNAYTVTYTAGTNGSGSYAHTSQPTGTYTLLPFASLTGVSASTGYRFKNYTVGGVNKNPGDTITLSAATSVTVNFEVRPLEGTYDFTNNWSTYASEWGGYASHTVTGTNVGADYEATIVFTNVSKQGGTITDRPVIAAKSGTTSTMLFTLDSSVSTTYKITTVEVAFVQWSASKKVASALYKGTTATGTVLDSFAQSETPRTLSTSNLNGDSFIVDFTTDQTSNQQLGITSITIGLEIKASYGTTNHIKVTSMPNTIYHIGEVYDGTGLAVTAYDGADEATANFKDVTSQAVTGFTSGIYTFDDDDVPTTEMFVQYTESGTTFEANPIVMHVYALAEYALVTETPSDWSGEYLLVGSYTDTNEVEHTVAINSALTNFDQPLNFKEVTISSGTITTGQELEWKVASYSSGYSMQGKNGKYAYGNSNNRFMTSDSAQQLTISLSSNIATITGASGFVLRMNSTTAGAERFGFYNTGSADIQLYKLVGSANADAYAQTFLGAISCDASGATAPTFNWKVEGVTRWSWALLAEEYNTLTAAEKEEFRLGVSSESGSNVEKALAKYDYIVGKYGTGTFSDFMLRSPSAPNESRINITSSNSAAIISIIAVLSLSAVAGFFMLRKRKEQ